MMRIKFPDGHNLAGYGIETTATNHGDVGYHNTKIVSYKNKLPFTLMTRTGYQLNGKNYHMHDVIKEFKEICA